MTAPAGARSAPAGAKNSPTGAKSPPAGAKSPPAGVRSPSAGVKSPPAGAKSPPVGARSPPVGARNALAGDIADANATVHAIIAAATGTSSSQCYSVAFQSNREAEWATDCLLRRPQAFASPDFSPGMEAVRRLAETRVLVVGAGGLGCEILKCLCLTGFKYITILDMDVIHISNLHRQFFFKEKHVAMPKAQVAAEMISRQFAHLNISIESCVCRLEEQDASFYRRFDIILSGLDSVEARRWLNAMVHNLAEKDSKGAVDLTTCIPLLDGGTEGLKGQARFIYPFVTSCFDCSLDSIPPQKTYPLCTIAETPRLPEHCVEHAMLVQWPKHEPFQPFDADSVAHLQWLLQAAQQRAALFGIEGVTRSLTVGVAKRIIPAVVSTNAIIAAILVEEALKIASASLCSSHDSRIAAATGPHAAAVSAAASERAAAAASVLHTSAAAAVDETAIKQPQEAAVATSLVAAGRSAAAEAESAADMLSGIENYIMYMGEAQIYMHTFEYAKKADCLVCSDKQLISLFVGDFAKMTLQQLIDKLAAEPSLALQRPSLTSARGIVFLQNPPQVRRLYEKNLQKSLRELQELQLLSEGEELVVTDPLLPTPLHLRLLTTKHPSNSY